MEPACSDFCDALDKIEIYFDFVKFLLTDKNVRVKIIGAQKTWVYLCKKRTHQRDVPKINIACAEGVL